MAGDRKPSASDKARETADDIAALARSVGLALSVRRLTLATAESCTGGLVGAAITAVAGSSDYYLGGVVAYANAAKVVLLGVDPAELAAHGAVSAATAKAMADGARVRLRADIAVSVTGIAGPGGGSAEKPVGLVYVGLAMAEGITAVRHMLTGDREAIRRAAVKAALAAVAAELESRSSVDGG